MYAISDKVPAVLGRGMAGEPLLAVESGRLVVLAGEMDAAPPASPENMRAHDAVIRRLARRCPALLPARFGWTAAGAELRRRLAPHRRELARALDEVRGCVQMTVRVFGPTPKAPTPKGPTSPRRGRGGASSGTSYLLERARVLRESETLPELNPLRARLQGLVRGERQERHGTGGLVGTAYHLVERGRLATYRARVRRAAADIDPLRLHLSGPWAAYAFGPRSLA